MSKTICARWVVELSDGSVIKENEGEWIPKVGERLPWPRLIEQAKEKGLTFTKVGLELFENPISIHPHTFLSFKEKPLFYDFFYTAEFNITSRIEKRLINLVGYYKDHQIHFIQENWGQSWIKMTTESKPLCPSPH